MLTEDYNKRMYLTRADMIFLFGSFLSGNFREESDIDIGIYFESKRYDKNSICNAVIDFLELNGLTR